MNLRSQLVIAFLVAALATVSPCRAQEKEIKRGDLPPRVEKTVAEQSKGATIRGFSKEVEDGKTYYEAQLTINGHGRDILIDEQGNVTEMEDEVSLDSLPADVKEGLEKTAGSGTIGKVESLTKNGTLVAYEAQVKIGNKRSEIQVGPDGKKLAHPE